MPWIKEEACRGCMSCARVCPADAITKEGAIAVINQSKCTKCGACFDACPYAIIRPNSENPATRGAGRGMGHGRHR